MNEKYPFFVYGTLIPGQPNDFYWQGCIGATKKAIFRGGRLFDMGSFPMLIEGGENEVMGHIMYPKKKLSNDEYQLLVQRLDTLENYDPENIDESPYFRVLRPVLIQDSQPVQTWVYIGRHSYTEGRPIIPSGDWVKYSASSQTHISIWWKEHGQDLFLGPKRN